MKPINVMLVAAALSAACVATAQAANGETPNRCVWLHNLDDFKPAADEKSLMIAESLAHRYNVTLMGRCIGLRYAETIAVKSVGGMFCLQPGDSISFNEAGGMRQRCMIDKIEPYVPPADHGDNSDHADSGDHAPSGY